MTLLSQAYDEALQIAALESSHLEHISRWQIQKSAFDGSLTRITGHIRHLEQKIKILDDAEVSGSSWVAWIVSLIYNPTEYTDEQKAQQKERRRENRTERDQMQEQLDKQKQDYKQEEDTLFQIKQESDAATLIIRIKIQEIRNTQIVREREEKDYRDRMNQDRWAKLRREQQEQRQEEDREAADAYQRQHMEKQTVEVSQQAAVRAAHRAQEEEEEDAMRRREVVYARQRQQCSVPPINFTQHGVYPSSSTFYDHGDW
jgi:hypothetical protein